MSTSAPDRLAARRTPHRTAVLVVAAIAGLHVLGWGTLLVAAFTGVARLSPDGAAPAATLAVGLTAYALGLRHAFDADHIAAIDNTTRSLQERHRPASTVGLWFSLGHSTVVFVLCTLLAAGLGVVSSALADDGSALHQVTGVWGPSVSSVFLLVLAGIGIATLASGRQGAGGPVWRALARAQSAIDRPSRMYGVGLLFGLGFDTATEIGLLALAGTATLTAVPWWVVLSLPVIFAAGMSMLDTTQGALARRAYAFAPDAPRRSAYATWMTALSVVAALVVAVVQLAGVAEGILGDAPRSAAMPVSWLAGLDIESLGLWLTALLLGTWAVVAASVLACRRHGQGV